jgi:hypothetical protein
MQSNPRILVNLLVILVKTPVNLLVKPTKLGSGGHGGGAYLRGCILAVPRIGGARGASGPGNTLGRGSYDLQL